MATAAPSVSLEEYLATSYEPDAEYAAGLLIRRNTGAQRHSLLQGIITDYLRRFRKSHNISVFPEGRLLVDPVRQIYRIPDVMVVEHPYQRGRVVVDVAAATIEIKSPDDTFDEVYGKCLEYDALGVRTIAVLDPEHRRQHLFLHDRLQTVEQLLIELRDGRQIQLPPGPELFAELDQG